MKIGKIFRLQEQQLEAKDRYGQNAAQAVFFGRFVTLLRIFAAFLGGITRMPYRQFLLCNFGGAAVWATTYNCQSCFLFSQGSFPRTNCGLDGTDRYCGIIFRYYFVTRPDSLGIWAEENKNHS